MRGENKNLAQPQQGEGKQNVRRRSVKNAPKICYWVFLSCLLFVVCCLFVWLFSISFKPFSPLFPLYVESAETHKGSWREKAHIYVQHSDIFSIFRSHFSSSLLPPQTQGFFSSLLSLYVSSLPSLSLTFSCFRCLFLILFVLVFI